MSGQGMRKERQKLRIPLHRSHRQEHAHGTDNTDKSKRMAPCPCRGPPKLSLLSLNLSLKPSVCTCSSPLHTHPLSLCRTHTWRHNSKPSILGINTSDITMSGLQSLNLISA